MKYYIGFPISLNCNLRCPYCFNQEFYSYVDKGEGINKWREKRSFSFDDYRKWRDKHLNNATDIIMHLFGGEPFCQQNIEDVFSIIEFMDKERIDILSNGICDHSVIERLDKYRHRFHRIGFTYHRDILKDNPTLTERYKRNVLLVKEMGIPVYVKEILVVNYRNEIFENKKFWLSQGVGFKIQDFKGIDRGISQEEYTKYTPLDYLLVDPEYKHGMICSCVSGYKNLFIRGFDMADICQTGSDVIACWHDPAVIGNILEDWFNPDYLITRKIDGIIEIKNVTKLYRGTHERDLPKLEKT